MPLCPGCGVPVGKDEEECFECGRRQPPSKSYRIEISKAVQKFVKTNQEIHGPSRRFGLYKNGRRIA